MTVHPWDVVECPFAWGTHPAVVVSNAQRCARKPEIVVLACRTMRPEAARGAEANEAMLDAEDGLDRRALCRCDLLFTVSKDKLTRRRGRVSAERQRDIGRRIIQGLALAGL